MSLLCKDNVALETVETSLVPESGVERLKLFENVSA